MFFGDGIPSCQPPYMVFLFQTSWLFPRRDKACGCSRTPKGSGWSHNNHIQGTEKRKHESLGLLGKPIESGAFCGIPGRTDPGKQYFFGKSFSVQEEFLQNESALVFAFGNARGMIGQANRPGTWQYGSPKIPPHCRNYALSRVSGCLGGAIDGYFICE